jgi:hypothetical protein
LLTKNLKIRIHRIIILPVVLYGCETWSLTWREEPRLRVLRIGRGENYIMRSLTICTPHPILFG